MAISFTTVCARPRDSKRSSRRLLELKQSQRSEDRQWNRREPRDIDGRSGSRSGRSAIDQRGRESINLFAERRRRDVYKVAVV